MIPKKAMTNFAQKETHIVGEDIINLSGQRAVNIQLLIAKEKVIRKDKKAEKKIPPKMWLDLASIPR